MSEPERAGEPGAAEPRRRRLLAWSLGGCTSGAVLLLVAGVVGWLVLGLFPVAWQPVREPARRATCKCNLRQIGLACHMYADDYDGEFPSGLQGLHPTYCDNPKVFKCPSGEASYEDFRARTVTEKSSSYVYVPGLRADMPSELILGCDKPENHPAKRERFRRHEAGRNVLFVDAHVEWWPGTREAELQARLRRQSEAVARWRQAGARPEDIPKFLKSAPPAGPK